jgi:arginase family enzyme
MMTYHILGVPLRSGSLTPGTEDDARAYRDAGLLTRLRDAGCAVVDDGDVPIPSYLPHHTVPPIRSWPGPRIVWEIVGEHLAPLLKQPDQVPLLIGCDCSLVVGTARALGQAASGDVHVIYVDGDFDDAPPDPAKSQSAAMLALWLLTNPSPFWPGPPLRPSQVTVIGTTTPARSDNSHGHALTLADVERLGPRAAARQALDAIPPSAAILLHLDTDVVRPPDLPATYFPHPEGMRWTDAHALVCELLADPRIRLVEISEYAALRDQDQRSVEKLVGLLADALKP